MDDSLVSLIEKATNPKNKYEDWEFIMSFCDKVNEEPQGPQTGLQLLVPKILDKDDKVALLSLTVLEACVKNCGQRFHQELGKFRFLNELIRMISPKYLGNQTSRKVKDKIKQLVYSWKLGLPNEVKIQEAYEMLKREGLLFDESIGADPTLEPFHAKPKVSLIEDPKQSQMLQKLLSSKNPEDLRAANRLIRDMVRRDDKRMQRLQKRLGELELVQNNIKLLSELLAHYSLESGEHEKALIKELYRALDNMRPNLLRMASDLKNNEEGMADILTANESLLRITDTYKRIFEEAEETSITNGTSTDTGITSSASASAVTQTATPTSAASPQTTGGVVNATSTGAVVSGSSDVLIDLADLDFGPPPSTSFSSQDGNVGSLFDDQGLLQDLLAAGPSTTNGQSSFTTPPAAPPTSQTASNIPPLIPPLSMGPFSMGVTNIPPPLSTQATPTSLIRLPPPPQAVGQSKLPPQPKVDPFAGLGLLSSPQVPATPPIDPLSVLDNCFVPLDTIQTGSLPPLQILNKENITISFHFAKNMPAPGVSVIVISILSTSPVPASGFQFQAAVPKVMRIKLQSPTGTGLNAYNPILPPATISQIMLLANPTKAKVRMKYRISFNKGGQETVELGEIPDFPETS